MLFERISKCTPPFFTPYSACTLDIMNRGGWAKEGSKDHSAVMQKHYVMHSSGAPLSNTHHLYHFELFMSTYFGYIPISAHLSFIPTVFLQGI